MAGPLDNIHALLPSVLQGANTDVVRAVFWIVWNELDAGVGVGSNLAHRSYDVELLILRWKGKDLRYRTQLKFYKLREANGTI